MKEIKPEEVSKRMKSKVPVSIIDVREDEEVAEGMIPGARHIPLGELPNHLDEIDSSKEHIMVCRSGGRSGKASEFLEEQGYDVRNMVGGMLDWKGDLKK
ncbi:rhodanese-like domain-containing protein [Halobacillus mangrovi]|uniref:rhodanese-like domain-containing protein n=1 Tax=Halobacillus mangrovi TaxID=402384 RepID=UPI003D996471